MNEEEKINFDKFESYLRNKKFGSTKSYLSYLNMLLRILEKIPKYKNKDETVKVLTFASETNDFKNDFNKFHTYESQDTFSDFRSAARKYKEYLTHSNTYNMNKTQFKINMNIKNIILYGAPGIGKTYNYKNLISMIENQEKSQKEIFDTIANNSEILENNIEIPKERVAFITFHQSYSYEDFIEGFRPQKDGTIQLKDGVFKEFCYTARKDKEQNYYLVIDEINRGNISKIFGELITLIEEDKREELSVILPYSKQTFSIPKNLYIIATMNSTDKSIATIDIALRRRFTFIKMKPNPDLVSDVNAKDFMIQLNEVIKERLGEDYMIGHSYFMGVETQEDLEFVKEYKIKPLLEEYFYASGESVEKILDEVQKQ